MQIDNSQFSSIHNEESNMNENMLEKFYEERQSFILDYISKKEKAKLPTNHQSNKHLTPRNKINFDAISCHKNIIPSNIITYEAFKEGSNRKTATEEPIRSESMGSLHNQNNTNINDLMNSNNKHSSHKNNNKRIEEVIESSSIKDNAMSKNSAIANQTNEHGKYVYNSFRKNNNQPQIKNNQRESKNINSKSNAITPIVLTDQNIRNNQHNSNILKTESRPQINTLNLFNREINLKSEITQNGLKNPQSTSTKPIRPMTPILSNKQNTITPNTSVNINMNINNNSSININDNKSFISNPIYANEIHNIISKRKAILEASNNQIKTKEEQFQDFYNRNIDYYRATKEKTDTRRDQLTKEKFDQCSFNPKVSQSTEKILNDSINYKDYKTENDFYKKNINWKNSRDKEIQHLSVLHDREKFEECYFHPTINKELHERILKEMKGQKPDYIYKKNIKWLAQVNENRKKGQLEQIEQMKIEQEKIKQQNQKLLNLGCQLRNNQSSLKTLNKLAQPKYPIDKHYQYRSQSEKKKNKARINTKTQEKDNAENTIGKDITEIKDLISSLKDTLNENRKMNINYNQDMILIDQRCNVNIVK